VKGLKPTFIAVLAIGLMAGSAVGVVAQDAELLPGVDLVTEEVEPGVFRVVGDGLHDLSGSVFIEYFPAQSDGRVVAGLDGSIWWLGPDGFFRLGEEGIHSWPTDVPADVPVPIFGDYEVGPEGTMWVTSSLVGSDLGVALRSFDGDSWTTRRKRPAKGTFGGVEIQQDGTVWVAERTGKHGTTWRVVRLDADGWEVLPGKIERLSNLDMSVAQDGGQEVWVMAPMQRLQRHDGSRWSVQQVPQSRLAPARLKNARRATVAPDGQTLWVLLRSGRELARFGGSNWKVYEVPDGGASSSRAYGAFFEAARDGSLWFNPIRPSDVACDGVANVDGDTVRYFLRDHCVYAMDIAPDGSVWLQAGENQGDPSLLWTSEMTDAPVDILLAQLSFPVHTYVITPEAVAVTE